MFGCCAVSRVKRKPQNKEGKDKEEKKKEEIRMVQPQTDIKIWLTEKYTPKVDKIRYIWWSRNILNREWRVPIREL